ncbi:thiamine biosynthesis lipoprotein [Mucilaginibacter yixingensis]|uniref:FAD:protein FMN transferase n=1 Tax=Mucilaginibacter yixingensis TaxID=1295612 RepID=A0A2T5JD07_9SPHI|nr:FAD:protein FMN transferase [Mucilaginibacter yixingensis]PTQ99651.1 thiamine biosynthesis lipoprotein [Mucilaginibacter yixingensis]
MQAVKNLISKAAVHRHEATLMGTHFELTVVSTEAAWAIERINSALAEIKRVDKLLTTLSEDSQINRINHNAGVAPVKVSGELFKLIQRSLEIAELTQGAFDITYGTNSGYANVMLSVTEHTVFLKNKGMRLYFGGVATGYAADRAKYVMQIEGVSNGVINAGGSLVTWGMQPDGSDWTIASADPEQCEQPYADYSISNMAIATSVNRQNELAGGAKSVCVMSPSAELAGALTNPIIMLGVSVGTELVNRLQQIACVFVDEYDQVFASRHMVLNEIV